MSFTKIIVTAGLAAILSVQPARASSNGDYSEQPETGSSATTQSDYGEMPEMDPILDLTKPLYRNPIIDTSTIKVQLTADAVVVTRLVQYSDGRDPEMDTHLFNRNGTLVNYESFSQPQRSGSAVIQLYKFDEDLDNMLDESTLICTDRKGYHEYSTIDTDRLNLCYEHLKTIDDRRTDCEKIIGICNNNA